MVAQLHNRGPGPNQIIELATGFWASKTLFTGVELGVFDALAAAPSTDEALASRLGLPSDSLQRLLGALGALGLLQRAGEGWQNTPATQRLLVRSSADFMGGVLEQYSHDLYPLWQYLPDAIRENSSRWQQVSGTLPRRTAFPPRTATSLRPASVLHAMDAMMQPVVAEVVACFDLAPCRHLLDVGGTLGTLAVAAASRYPALTATIFDLPVVQPLTEARIAEHDLVDRIEFVAGDVFQDALPHGADLLTLGSSLHEWNDRTCVAVLRCCYDALAAGGTILLLEKVLDEDRLGPVLPALMNLNLLVVAEGCERTETEYRTLLQAAGFVDMHVQRLTGPRDLVYAHKS